VSTPSAFRRIFPDFDIKREEIARYGLTVMDIGQIIESAIGGESIATTIEGASAIPSTCAISASCVTIPTSCGASSLPP
jgi:Cu/Ag efflux pump CusA